jgi:uncharacterized protein YuzB (UPF0349 family)
VYTKTDRREELIDMRPIIEFCVNNMASGSEKVMKELEVNPDYDVIDYGCLGNCGECYTNPYALVNGEIVSGESPEQLLDNIHKVIKQMEEEFNLDLS